jgi:hypothetical protein
MATQADRARDQMTTVVTGLNELPSITEAISAAGKDKHAIERAASDCEDVLVQAQESIRRGATQYSELHVQLQTACNALQEVIQTVPNTPETALNSTVSTLAGELYTALSRWEGEMRAVHTEMQSFFGGSQVMQTRFAPDVATPEARLRHLNEARTRAASIVGSMAGWNAMNQLRNRLDAADRYYQTLLGLSRTLATMDGNGLLVYPGFRTAGSATEAGVERPVWDATLSIPQPMPIDPARVDVPRTRR